jgi:hypothetical protein
LVRARAKSARLHAPPGGASTLSALGSRDCAPHLQAGAREHAQPLGSRHSAQPSAPKSRDTTLHRHAKPPPQPNGVEAAGITSPHLPQAGARASERVGTRRHSQLVASPGALEASGSTAGLAVGDGVARAALAAGDGGAAASTAASRPSRAQSSARASACASAGASSGAQLADAHSAAVEPAGVSRPPPPCLIGLYERQLVPIDIALEAAFAARFRLDAAWSALCKSQALAAGTHAPSSAPGRKLDVGQALGQHSSAPKRTRASASELRERHAKQQRVALEEQATGAPRAIPGDGRTLVSAGVEVVAFARVRPPARVTLTSSGWAESRARAFADALQRSRKNLKVAAREVERSGHGPCSLADALRFYYTTFKATGEYAVLSAELKARTQKEWVRTSLWNVLLTCLLSSVRRFASYSPPRLDRVSFSPPLHFIRRRASTTTTSATAACARATCSAAIGAAG